MIHTCQTAAQDDHAHDGVHVTHGRHQECLVAAGSQEPCRLQKCGRDAIKNAQATADEDALGQFAQQTDEMVSYQNKQPRFLIIKFDEIEEPVLLDAHLQQ